MKIRITDIPPEGVTTQFPLDVEAVNHRVAGDASLGGEESRVEKASRARESHEKTAAKGGGRKRKGEPEVAFTGNPEVSLEIVLEGRTVHLSGSARGELKSPCARCAEPAFQVLDVPIGMTLKPESERERDAVEDIDFGYYAGEEIDCSAVAEEALMLAIPYVSVCSESCKGLCPVCGANKNQTSCSCQSAESSNSPFSVLKDLKIIQ